MTQPDVQATLQARFVDDDTLVRTGRALLEVNGHGWVMVPVPDGWAEQVQAVLDVEVDTDTISVFVDAAEAAAVRAEAGAATVGDAQTVLDARDQAVTAAGDADAAAREAATLVQGFNITFTEDPPGSGLFAVPSHGLIPDPDNPGLYLIGA